MMEPAAKLDPDSLVARIIAELEANRDAQELLWRALSSREFQGIPVRLTKAVGSSVALWTQTWTC